MTLRFAGFILSVSIGFPLPSGLLLRFARN
jgi:hypothetical protein